MKILYFYNDEWEKKYVAANIPDHEISFLKGGTEDHLDLPENDSEIVSIFVNSKVDRNFLNKFPNLKMIATRSTGYDHIDLDEVKKRKVLVSNVPTYGENTVAEFAFSLILALSRKIYDSYKRIEQGGNFSQNGLTGFDLKGKTLGIVGTGHIGAHSAKIAKGFEMNVIAYDKFPNNKLAKDLGFKYVSFDDLLSQSDVISLHAPYNKDTHHMINLDNINKIKKGAYLVNTARGGLVDTTAVVRALKDEILGGAGLDVLEEEGYMVDEMKLLSQDHPELESLKTILENHYLIDHPRVIITPHNAFNTKEAIIRIINTSLENIKSFTSGKSINVIS